MINEIVRLRATGDTTLYDAIGDGASLVSKTSSVDTANALVVLTDLRARGPLEPADDVIKTMGVEPLSLDTYLRNAANKAGFPITGTITPRNPVTRNGPAV